MNDNIKSPAPLNPTANASNSLPIGDLVRMGWNTLWLNPAPPILYALIVCLAMSVWVIPLLGVIAAAILIGPLLGGFFIGLSRQSRGEKPELGDFFAGLNMFVPLMLVGLMGMLFTGIGFTLLLIPGIYLLVSYQFSLFFASNKLFGWWDALEASRKMITPRWFDFLGLFLVLTVMNIAGVWCLGVGVLITMPWSLATLLHAYQHCTRNS
jgi:uncharacterized membrane protein